MTRIQANIASVSDFAGSGNSRTMPQIIVELVAATADELEEDIRKLEADAHGAVTIHIEPKSGA